MCGCCSLLTRGFEVKHMGAALNIPLVWISVENPSLWSLSFRNQSSSFPRQLRVKEGAISLSCATINSHFSINKNNLTHEKYEIVKDPLNLIF